MDNRLPWDITATDADGGKTAPAARAQVVQRLIVVMLVTAAGLDLTRCGLVMAAARYPAPTAGLVTAGLVTAGLAAATLTARTARGCRAGHRWAGWAALLIGAASVPQAAASGFRSPYTIPDTATAVLGMLLAITILATAGRMDRRDTTPHIPVCWTGEPRCDPERSRACTSSRSAGRHRARRWVLNVLVDVPGRLSRIFAGAGPGECCVDRLAGCRPALWRLVRDAREGGATTAPPGCPRKRSRFPAPTGGRSSWRGCSSSTANGCGAPRAPPDHGSTSWAATHPVYELAHVDAVLCGPCRRLLAVNRVGQVTLGRVGQI